MASINSVINFSINSCIHFFHLFMKRRLRWNKGLGFFPAPSDGSPASEIKQTWTPHGWCAQHARLCLFCYSHRQFLFVCKAITTNLLCKYPFVQGRCYWGHVRLWTLSKLCSTRVTTISGAAAHARFETCLQTSAQPSHYYDELTLSGEKA